jgi:hypothetical protein
MKFIDKIFYIVGKISSRILGNAISVNEIERYIIGHNPLTHSQVDSLIKNYERKNSGLWKL